MASDGRKMPQNGAKAGVFEPSQAQPLIGANVKRVAGSRFDTVCDLIQSGAQDGPFLGRRQPLGLSSCTVPTTRLHYLSLEELCAKRCSHAESAEGALALADAAAGRRNP